MHCINWFPSFLNEHLDQLIQEQRIERIVVQHNGMADVVIEYPASK